MATAVETAVGSQLPADFLQGSAPHITKTVIDWAKTDLPEYEGLYAVILENVLSLEECKQLVAAAEFQTNGEWERAMVNVGGGRQRMYTDVRNCGRIIWDDRDLAQKIWDRCSPVVPEIHELKDWPKVTGTGPAKWEETWKLTRPNERLRFLKYVGGEYFRPHCDGSYETPDRTERSYFTLHLYLNESTPGEELIGGATTFHSYNEKQRLDVAPKTGSVLIFQHRFLMHSGDDVLRGTKLTMRTDLMYTKTEGKDRTSGRH